MRTKQQTQINVFALHSIVWHVELQEMWRQSQWQLMTLLHWGSALNIFNLSRLPLTVDHIGKVFNHFLLHRSTKKSFSVVMATNISCHKGLVMTTKKFSSLLMNGLAQHRDTSSFFICPEIPLGNHQPWDTTIVTWTAIGNLSNQFHGRLPRCNLSEYTSADRVWEMGQRSA